MPSSTGPFPPEHVDIIWSGVFGATAAPYEIWSMGVAISYDTGQGIINLAALALSARTAWTTHVAGQVNPQARLTRVRAVLVGGDGHYKTASSGAYALADEPADSPGTGVLSQMPPLQVALAISLRSVVPGSVGRGRFYLPAPDLGILTAGQITAARQASFLNAMKSFLDAVNATARGQGAAGVTIASRGSVKKGIPPGLRTVVDVGVGRVPDTIRTRRNDVPEAYSRIGLA